MAGSLKNIGLTSLDDLFKTDEQRQADAQERVQIVPADQVFPYARQPYSIDRPTQDLAQLMDSIERVGIADPLIVRPRDDLLPSEKARAYKLRLDAMKRQGERTDIRMSYAMK